ncbi:MAG TPA: hypothetical protein PLS58_12915, partial [Bacteroidales bacterium]|nr:hypothetical protein [Bacteroidales bacterium]HQG78387.1 hypothetical protein [Bacteroidales bacterium]
CFVYICYAAFFNWNKYVNHTRILYQIVFDSKNYTYFLNKENQGPLFGYLVGMLSKRGCHPYRMGEYGI